MNSIVFPAAIVASWIVVIVIRVGMKYAKEENATGREPPGSTRFVFTCFGIAAVFGYLGFSLEVPFFYYLTNILTGALIGLGSAYFVPRIVHSLLRGPSQ